MLDIKPKKFKVHSLTGRIDPKLMEKAWKAVKKNRGACGIDKITIDDYAKNLPENLYRLMKNLKTRNALQVPPLRRVYIPKEKGKLRPLGIPTVPSRIAQEVIRQLLNPIFEKQFHDDSFGFRPGRNCHQAVERVLKYMDEGYKWVVDADIKGFFDNIPHHVIMTMLRAEIADGNVLDIAEKFLTSGVMEEGQLQPTTRGTPQGGVISPLYANIVLNYLDWKLAERGYRFVRYADDLVILCKTEPQAKEALDFLKQILTDLELELSPEKTLVTRASKGFSFLGFLIRGKHSVNIRQKSKEKFKAKIKELTTRSRNLDKVVIETLNRVIRGTVNYFYTIFSTTLDLFTGLDKWIRERIRQMKYKRKWKTDHRRLKNRHIANKGLLSCRELCLARKL
jgi:RNA-directed DNA polymerase